MAETATPHDAVFKTFLSCADTARDFIRLHLPTQLLQLCKLETLRLESGSYIEDDLRPYYSDVIYSLQTTTGRGYIHVLIEHQSTPDKHMAFRLLRYAVADEIMQHRSMAALTLVQKHIRQRDIALLQDKLASLFILGHMSGQQITVLVNYLIQAGQTQDVQKLLYGLAQRVPQHGEKFMTMAEQLRKEGIQEGKLVTLRNVAKAMLARGFDSNLITEITGLSADELQQLRQ